jgi:hypothetical protein
MTAAALEAVNVYRYGNEVKKTKLHFRVSPAAGINTMLCTCAAIVRTKQHGCQSFGSGLKSRGFDIGAAVRSLNHSLSRYPPLEVQKGQSNSR